MREWLVHRYYQSESQPPGAQMLQNVLGMLEAQARYEGECVGVSLRLAAQADALYVDLANADWEAVEVTTKGWRLITVPPVRFRRTRGMSSLPLHNEVGPSSCFVPLSMSLMRPNGSCWWHGCSLLCVPWAPIPS